VRSNPATSFSCAAFTGGNARSMPDAAQEAKRGRNALFFGHVSSSSIQLPGQPAGVRAGNVSPNGDGSPLLLVGNPCRTCGNSCLQIPTSIREITYLTVNKDISISPIDSNADPHGCSSDIGQQQASRRSPVWHLARDARRRCGVHHEHGSQRHRSRQEAGVRSFIASFMTVATHRTRMA